MKYLFIVFAFCFMVSFSSCATRVHRPNTTVVVVKKRPANYKVVRVNGVRYYKWNGKHYKKTRRGYVFVRL